MSDVYHLPRLEKLLKAQNINKKINFYTSTESTNLLASQTSSDEIFLADHQSNGRGRRGKTWITPSGQSIALSVSHRFQAPLAELAGLNIAVAVAVIKTFNHFGIEGFFLKWPNDIYGDNGKVGGILIEASGNQVNSRAIVGIGLNWCVDQALQQDISQKHMNIPTKNLDKTNFVAQLIIQLEKTFKEFNNNQLNLLMSIWNQYDKYRNQQVQIIQGDSHTLAKYLNITSKGELLVKIGNETKTISAGEVSMRKVD